MKILNYCRNCGSPIEKGYNHCKTCGFKIGIGSKFCGLCGKKIEYFGDISKCPFCKEELKEKKIKQIDSKEKKKFMLAAGLLQIFCPFLALGRFYLGFYKLALIQILVTVLTFGLGFFWPFIDGLLILKGKIKKDAFGIELLD